MHSGEISGRLGMCDDSETKDQNLQGNVLPLFPREAFKNNGKGFAADAHSEPDRGFEMRTVRYYPDAQKEYARNLLRRLISEKALSPQALRDEIMAREDAALIEASGWTPQRKNAAPPREDRLLSRADPAHDVHSSDALQIACAISAARHYDHRRGGPAWKL